MSINRRLGESEGFGENKGRYCDSILRLLGFVAEWYIDKVDVSLSIRTSIGPGLQ